MTLFRPGGGEGLGPALSRSAAGAACIERLLELEGVGQIGVGLAIIDTASSIVRQTVANRARPSHRARETGKPSVVRRVPAEIGDGKEGAVTGAHADDAAPAERDPFRAFGAEMNRSATRFICRGSAVLCGVAASRAMGAAPHRAQPPLCESASPAASAKANKAQLSAAPHRVREVRKSTPRGAAIREASQWRTTDITVLATFPSPDYAAII